jgi:hypothetical protein
VERTAVISSVTVQVTDCPAVPQPEHIPLLSQLEQPPETNLRLAWAQAELIVIVQVAALPGQVSESGLEMNENTFPLYVADMLASVTAVQ